MTDSSLSASLPSSSRGLRLPPLQPRTALQQSYDVRMDLLSQKMMPSSTKGCCIVNRLIQTDVSIKSSMIQMGRKNLNIGGFKVDNFQQKYPFYFEIILCYKGQILSRGLTWDKSPLWKYADGPRWPLPPWSPGIQY